MLSKMAGRQGEKSEPIIICLKTFEIKTSVGLIEKKVLPWNWGDKWGDDNAFGVQKSGILEQNN